MKRRILRNASQYGVEREYHHEKNMVIAYTVEPKSLGPSKELEQCLFLGLAPSFALLCSTAYPPFALKVFWQLFPRTGESYQSSRRIDLDAFIAVY